MTKHYTVQQLAKLSGVTVRTLHHYDRIGLLVPAFFGDNGYRYYREAELLRLQQILFFREFGIPLKEIGELLQQSGDLISLLAQHRTRLQAEAERFRQLVETIDRTIASLKGKLSMPHQELYKGFSPEQQARYQAEAIDRYGEHAVKHSVATLNAMTPLAQQAQMDELAEMEAGVAACMREQLAFDDKNLNALLARHRAWIETMWGKPCSLQAYAGLADLYSQSPDFRARFESIEPGLAEYFAAAMKAYVERLTP